MEFSHRVRETAMRSPRAAALAVCFLGTGSRVLAAVSLAALIGCGKAARFTAHVSPAPNREMRTVTVHEGTELVASLSPDGRRIAFILLGQTWLMDAGGGRASALTNAVEDPSEDWSLAWGPDSRRLAVWTARQGRSRVRVIDVQTCATLRTWDALTTLDPVWDRSRDALQTVQIRRDSTWLWAMPSDSGRPRVLVRSFGRSVSGMAYAPDGRSMAFVGPYSGNQIGITPTSASDIWEMDVATGAERRLTADSTRNSFPAYSPDGRWLAFLSERSGSRQVWLLPRSGGDPQPLTTRVEDVELASLSWLPDSRAVMYTAAGKIRVSALDGGADRMIEFAADLQVAHWRSLKRPELPEPGAHRQVRGIVTPELSPDGRQVAFAALGDLWVANVAGGAPRRLTRTQADEMHPRWSPDGTRLAFVVNAPNVEREVRVLEVADPDRVRRMSVSSDQFAWSPDGTRLASIDDSRRIVWCDVGTGRTKVVGALPRGAGQSLLLGWTARGDSIAFASGVSLGDSYKYGNRVDWSVWSISADSGRAVPSSLNGVYAVRASWSADLSRAAYADFSRGFYVALHERGRPVPISDPSPRFFSWSADDRLLLYLSGDRLRVLDVARNEARTLEIKIPYEVAAAPPSLLIRNVRIIDGTGRGASAPSDVLVENGRIARISAAGIAPPPVTAGVVDGGGRTLMPGLFNLHAHQNPQKLFLASNLYHGVTSIRDVGMTAEWMQSQRERVDAGDVVGPHIFATGGLFFSTAGLGSLNQRLVDATDSVALANDIASVAAVGTDIVKSYGHDPQLDAVVGRAAHAAGLPTTSHYVFLGRLANGLEGKEHALLYYRNFTAPYREDVVQALHAADACVTATLLVYPSDGRSQRLPLDRSFFDDTAFARLYPPNVLEQARAGFGSPTNARALADWRQFEGWDLANMLRLHRAGVRVVTGTDVGAPMDEAGVLLETQLLVIAGFTPLEAIRAATLDAASCLGVERELGSVEVGKRADLLIVDGNPATDIRDLKRIAWVVLGGAPYTRQEILATVRP